MKLQERIKDGLREAQIQSQKSFGYRATLHPMPLNIPLIFPAPGELLEHQVDPNPQVEKGFRCYDIFLVDAEPTQKSLRNESKSNYHRRKIENFQGGRFERREESCARK